MGTSEFEKLKKESVSPSQSVSISQSQSVYEDDFGSDESENNQEKEKEDELDIEEDIDEDIEIDSASEDNVYCAKEEHAEDKKNDERITNDFNLETVSDIIINAKTEKIDFK